MALLADDNSVEEMKRWIGIVAEYNKSVEGQGSPREVVTIDKNPDDPDDTYTLKVRKKKT